MKKVTTLFLIICIFLLNNVCFASTTDDISVSRTEKILKSELKKYYAGFEYIITNNSQKRLNILNAQIANGTNGSIAYNQSEVSSGKSIGVLWAVMGPVGIFTFGIGWLAGIIGTPVAWLIGHNKNKKLRNESMLYTNMIPLGYIEPQENITVLTLIPLGAQPQLKLTVYDDKSKNYNVFNY